MKRGVKMLFAGLGGALALWPAMVEATNGTGIRARTEQIRLAQIRFEDTRADAALEQLSEAARQADPSGRGVNLVYHGDPAALPHVTLRLRQVSLYDALRYLAEVSGLHLRLDANVVVLSREPQVVGRTETRTYPVQPSLLDRVRVERDARETARESPFSFRRP